MSIETWMPTLRTNIAAVTGIVQASQYDDVPATLSTFPCAIILPVSGAQIYSAGGPNIAIHRVRIAVYVAAQVLPEAYGVAVPFIALIRNKIAANMTLSGLVQHCLPVSDGGNFYEGPGGLAYGDKTHLGIVFNVEVKETETFTVAA